MNIRGKSVGLCVIERSRRCRIHNSETADLVDGGDGLTVMAIVIATGGGGKSGVGEVRLEL